MSKYTPPPAPNGIPVILRSSADPTKVSLTVKGILIALLPAFLLVAKAQGWAFAEADAVQVIEAVTQAIAALLVVYGLIRKAVIWLQAR